MTGTVRTSTQAITRKRRVPHVPLARRPPRASPLVLAGGLPGPLRGAALPPSGPDRTARRPRRPAVLGRTRLAAAAGAPDALRAADRPGRPRRPGAPAGRRTGRRPPRGGPVPRPRLVLGGRRGLGRARPASSATPRAPPPRPGLARAGRRPGAAPAACARPRSPRPRSLRRPGPVRRRGGRPGDTLWTLAASRLPATATTREVAAAWPAWWSANRTVIGADPDLLRPGQSLQPPTAAGRP